MGVGKTTIGEILAKKLDYDFIDMDAEIEKREGATISEIFRIQGEQRFRKIESRLVEDLSQNDKIVIACGGGTITNLDNAETISKTSRMVYLTASIKEIIKRTNQDNNRPLLQVQNPYDIALELIKKRKPVYSKYAEITIDTTGKTPDEVVEMVMEALF
jgi:shikimate kinase